MLRPFVSLLLTGLLATVATGCGDDNPVTPTETQAQSYIDVYTGQLGVGATGFYAFTVVAPGTAAITLGSVTDAASGRALDTALELGIGIPAGQGCHVTRAVTVSPGLAAHLQQPLTDGVYCVQLRDVGRLRVLVNFGVRILHT
ncbi:MAG: hypothetical protein AB7Q29_04480 [Vicinamibacterales bacterium]